MTRPGWPIALTFLSTVAALSPARAVGLGPLSEDGIIDGPRKGFGLTLYNPYEEPTTFRAYAVGPDDEMLQSRVDVMPAEARLAAHGSRRILVIANDLAVGETFRFRLCAERQAPPSGVTINARVCSKLSARRVS